MTAATVAGTAPGSFEEDLRAALDAFVAAAATSGVPAPVVRAMRSPEASTVNTSVGGVPVSLPIPAGRLEPAEIPAAWQRLRYLVTAVEDLEAVS